MWFSDVRFVVRDLLFSAGVDGSFSAGSVYRPHLRAVPGSPLPAGVAVRASCWISQNASRS